MIRKVPPDRLPWEALVFLKKAAQQNPLMDDPDLWEILESGGDAYVIEENGTVIGALYVEYMGDAVHVSLLGMNGLSERRIEIEGFFRSLMREKGKTYLSIFGRASWHKMFKSLRPVGTFFVGEGGPVTQP